MLCSCVSKQHKSFAALDVVIAHPCHMLYWYMSICFYEYVLDANDDTLSKLFTSEVYII
jgi:hypothetical protein